MAKQSRYARLFRQLSFLVYLVDFTIALLFAMKTREYLFVVVSIITMLLSLCMIIAVTEKPKKAFMYIEHEQSKLNFLLTYRGRYVFDMVMALFIFGMGLSGIIMACVTLLLIMGIRFVGIVYPDLFNEIFRTPIDDDDQTLSTYGGTLETDGDYTLDTRT